MRRLAALLSLVLAAPTTAAPLPPDPDLESSRDRLARSPPRPPPDYGRTAVETLLFVGFGTGWYWLNADENSPDWDYSRLDQRFSEGHIRFDNNHYTINNLVHPVDGAAYHVFARANALPVHEAFLTGFVASTGWEYVLEYRERVSINDLVFTPVGGMALGEVLFQLGDYLSSAPEGGTWAHEAAAWTLGLPTRLHAAMDGRSNPPGPTDRLGFSARRDHDFRFGYEALRADDEEASHGLFAHVRIDSLRGHGQPGRFRLLYLDGNQVDLQLRMLFREAGSAELDLRARAALLGYYTQTFDRFGDGSSGAARLTLAFEHTQRWLPGPQDRISTVHLPGPSAELRSRQGALDLQLRVDLWPDFAAVDALAYPAWRDANPTATTKSVVEEFGYYYAFGLTAQVEGSARWGALEVGGRARHSRLESFDGLDRLQETVTADVRERDLILELGGWIGYVDPDTLTHVRLGIEGLQRTSEVGDVRAHLERRRVLLQVGLAL